MTKPFELRSLLKYKATKSKLDIKAYQKLPRNLLAYQRKQQLASKFTEKDPDGGEDSPLDPKPTKRTTFNTVGKIQTLDQILGMIERDAVINEERFECDSEGGKAGSTDEDEDEGADEEYLDAQDMKILRDRIIQAIEIFSKWNPHMKKEILKQRKINKLSIENRSRGNGGANSSKKSKSERSYSQQGDEKSAQGTVSPRKSGVLTTGRRGTMNTTSLKQQQMDIIDAFLKEYGLINPKF